MGRADDPPPPAGHQDAVDSQSGATAVVDPVEGTCPCPEPTIADWPTNEGYPVDDQVIEAGYLADRATRDDPPHYSVWLSRLERTEDGEIVE